MTAVRLSWSQIGRIIMWGTPQLAARLRLLRHDVSCSWALRSRGKGSCSRTEQGQLAASLPITPAPSSASWRAPSRWRWSRSAGPRRAPRTPSCSYRVISFWMILAGRVALHRPARAPGAPWALAPPGPGERGRGRPRGLRGSGCGADADPHGPRRQVPAPTPAACRGRGVRAARAGAHRGPLVLAAALLASCSSARIDTGTTPTRVTWPCRRRPRRSAATATSRGCASTRSQPAQHRPEALRPAGPDVSKKQAICVAGYTGHFTSSEVSKPLGHPSGTLAVAVVTTPGNRLLGTLFSANPRALPAHLPVPEVNGVSTASPGHPSRSGSTPPSDRARRRSARTQR